MRNFKTHLTYQRLVERRDMSAMDGFRSSNVVKHEKHTEFHWTPSGVNKPHKHTVHVIHKGKDGEAIHDFYHTNNADKAEHIKGEARKDPDVTHVASKLNENQNVSDSEAEAYDKGLDHAQAGRHKNNTYTVGTPEHQSYDAGHDHGSGLMSLRRREIGK